MAFSEAQMSFICKRTNYFEHMNAGEKYELLTCTSTFEWFGAKLVTSLYWIYTFLSSFGVRQCSFPTRASSNQVGSQGTFLTGARMTRPGTLVLSTIELFAADRITSELCHIYTIGRTWNHPCVSAAETAWNWQKAHLDSAIGTIHFL